MHASIQASKSISDAITVPEALNLPYSLESEKHTGNGLDLLMYTTFSTFSEKAKISPKVSLGLDSE